MNKEEMEHKLVDKIIEISNKIQNINIRGGSDYCILPTKYIKDKAKEWDISIKETVERLRTELDPSQIKMINNN